mmetsp:Transcript_50946/g.163032  ORF Transcript_50946/g.163032 Transcript_50946/m.163032 type:complete len:253 (+) Transcript_50946:365-1123(+)
MLPVAGRRFCHGSPAVRRGFRAGDLGCAPRRANALPCGLGLRELCPQPRETPSGAVVAVQRRGPLHDGLRETSFFHTAVRGDRRVAHRRLLLGASLYLLLLRQERLCTPGGRQHSLPPNRGGHADLGSRDLHGFRGLCILPTPVHWRPDPTLLKLCAAAAPAAASKPGARSGLVFHHVGHQVVTLRNLAAHSLPVCHRAVCHRLGRKTWLCAALLPLRCCAGLLDARVHVVQVHADLQVFPPLEPDRRHQPP